MQNFARLPASERAKLFEIAADASGLLFPIIEKDFWVCWMLERLWNSPFAAHLLFKGGTSLSKCFDLIARFSEDIDIGLDRALLGFDGDNDPLAEDLSRSARTRRVDALKAAAKAWIETTFLEKMTQIIRAELGEESATGWNWNIETDTDGMPKLRWNPPRSLPRGAQPEYSDAYLNRGVLIEIGARAAHWPASRHAVSSYVAQQIPEAFKNPSATVCALDVRRTFWEKATILHVLNHEAEADEKVNKPPRERERFSRHCYDLHCIAQSTPGTDAARDFDLLADVVRFKRTFFCSSTAKEALYEDARPGTLRLAPHAALAAFFADDYAKMQRSGMFFKDSPSWSEIRQTLQLLEERINAV